MKYFSFLLVLIFIPNQLNEKYQTQTRWFKRFNVWYLSTSQSILLKVALTDQNTYRKADIDNYRGTHENLVNAWKNIKDAYIPGRGDSISLKQINEKKEPNNEESYESMIQEQVNEE